MNILLLCDEYPPGRHGGIGTAVQSLARALVRLGHTVIVAGFYDWLYGGDDQFEDQGVIIYRFRRNLRLPPWKRDALPARMLYRILRISGVFERDIVKSLPAYGAFLNNIITTHDIDVVEQPDYFESFVFCRAPISFPAIHAPKTIKMHGSNTFFKALAQLQPDRAVFNNESTLLDSADALCAVSRFARDETVKLFGIARDVAILHNGVERSPLESLRSVAKQRKKVVFYGTLIEKKGVFQLARAWTSVVRRHPDAVLHIFGKGDTRPLRAILSAAPAQSYMIHGHTPQAELFPQVSGAGVAVFPSFAETFGLAPAEAMALGTSVIFTTRTSGPEVVTDGVNGLLADPGNPEDLAGAIIRLLDDPDLQQTFARNALKEVRDRFDIDTVAAQHVAFWQRLLDERAG